MEPVALGHFVVRRFTCAPVFSTNNIILVLRITWDWYGSGPVRVGKGSAMPAREFQSRASDLVVPGIKPDSNESTGGMSCHRTISPPSGVLVNCMHNWVVSKSPGLNACGLPAVTIVE